MTGDHFKGWACILVLVGACSGPPPAPATTTAPPTSIASAPPTTVAAPPPPDHTFRRRTIGARFSHDQLVECAETDLVLTPQEPLPAVWPPVLPEQPRDADTIEIHRPCEEQFSDHTLVGRCTGLVIVDETDEETGGHVHLSIEEHWYDVETLRSDAHMRECLEHGGEWWGMPRDSPEAHRVLLQEAASDLHHAGHGGR